MPIIFRRAYAIPPFILQWFIRLFVLFVFKIFAHLKVENIEVLKGCGVPLIFVSNHSSEWDGPLIRSVMPMFSRFGPMFYASREKSFYAGSGWRAPFYGGLLFKLVGAYPVSIGQRDYALSLKNQFEILKDGGSITIFPEGGTGKGGVLKEGKAGVIYLSSKTQTAIVPIGITGLYDLSLKELFGRKRRVVVTFGNPYIPHVSGDNDEAYVAECKARAQELMILILSLMQRS